MNRKFSRIKAALIALGVGAMPLVTTASCDPVTGAFRFFRDTDNYYDDCGYGGCFGGGYYDGYYGGGYYEESYYYDDYYYDCYYCY